MGKAHAATAAVPIGPSRVRRQIASLEGEILQEHVFAEELKCTDHWQELQLCRLLESMGESVTENSSCEQPLTSLPLGVEAITGLLQEPVAAKQFEDKTACIENTRSASEVHALLIEHESNLRRQLTEVEADMQFESEYLVEASNQRNETATLRVLTSSTTDEAAAENELRHTQEATCLARTSVDRLRTELWDLSTDCGTLWLESRCFRDQEIKLFASLQEALPPEDHVPMEILANSEGPTLDDLLWRLEEEHPEVRENFHRADLHIHGAVNDSLSQQVASLEEVLAEVEAERLGRHVATQHARAETQVAASMVQQQVLDRQSELSDLRQELGLLGRQCKECQRMQNRMQRILDDLQRSRSEGARGQAVITQRLTELKRESQALDADCSSASSAGGGFAPPPQKTTRQKTQRRRRLWPGEGPSSSDERTSRVPHSSGNCHADSSRDKRRIEIRAESVALRQQIAKLEEEKLNLIQSQRDLYTYVQTRMPQLESVLGRDVYG